jgi:hypothetical protein
MLVLLLAMQVALAASPSPATEAALPPEAGSGGAAVGPGCKVVEIPAGSRGTHTVFAACGSEGLLLGSVDTYRSSYNAATQSLAVETVTGRTKRVLLISRGSGGAMHVDDLTRELAKFSGRYGDAGLESVDVDLTGVPASGIIRVPVKPLARAAAGEAGPPTVSGPAALDLRPYVARAHAAAP